MKVSDYTRISSRIHKAAEERGEEIPENLRSRLDEVMERMRETYCCRTEDILGMKSIELTPLAEAAAENLISAAKERYGEIFA